MKPCVWRLLCWALVAQAAKAQTHGPGSAAPAAARNPFAPVSWLPPAPAPSVVPAAPARRAAAPSAPALPFRYLGTYTAEAQLVVLTMGERMLVAKAGDILEGMWRIDRVDAAQVEFTYLPLKLKRWLAAGDAGQEDTHEAHR